MALPTRGQRDWDDELNNEIQRLDSDVQGAVADSASAKADAAYAKAKADEAVADVATVTDSYATQAQASASDAAAAKAGADNAQLAAEAARDAASGSATAAASSASDAAASAAAASAPTDARVASLVEDSASATATALSATYASVPNALKPRLRVRPKPVETVVTTFQTSHGWTADGTHAAANLNDTSAFAFGSQSASVTTNGAGGGARLTRLGAAALDASSGVLQFTLRFTNLAALKTLTFYAGASGFANYYTWTPINNPGTNSDGQYWVEGEWAHFTLPWESAATSGAPSKANLTDFRILAVDQATGTQVTMHAGKVSVLPKGNTYPNGVCVFMFDDGYVDTYTEGRRKLSQYDFRATALPIVDLVGTASYLSLTQLQELQNLHGWEIGAHAYTVAAHNAGFTTLTAAQVDDEMRLNKKWLVDNGLTSGLDLFAYPRGYYNPTVLEAARGYFSAARGTFNRQRETYPPADKFKMRCRGLGNGSTLATVQTDVDNAVANGSMLILLGHRLQSTAADSSTWAIADWNALVDHVAASGIAVRTLGQALRGE